MNILSEEDEGKKIVEQYIDYEPAERKVDVELRKKIVNISVGWIIRHFGYYPEHGHKEKVAKTIVTGFPRLGIKDDKGEIDCSHFYGRETGGFIETRLKTIRDQLRGEIERKRKPNAKPTVRNKKAMRPNDGSLSPLDVADLNAKVVEIFCYLFCTKILPFTCRLHG